LAIPSSAAQRELDDMIVSRPNDKAASLPEVDIA
jgi:hypothetical protein